MTIELIRAYDIIPEVSNSYYKNEQFGEPTGWMSLDKYYTVLRGQMSIVTGVPSHGKTEFIDALSMNLAKDKSWAFLVYSPENYPLATHVKSLARKFVGKPFGKMYNGTMSEEEAANAIAFINGAYIFIKQSDELVTVKDIIDITKNVSIDGLIIDPWNEIDHKRPAGMREDEYISYSLGRLRENSRAQNLHTWLVAHPKLPQPGRSYKTNPPGLYDISGGAHWYNKADVGITVHRPDVINGTETNIHITKVRFRSIGKPTGENPVALYYNAASGRYTETA